MRISVTVAASLGLVACFGLASVCPAAPPLKNAKTNIALIAKGKALSNSKKCTGCHGPDMAGRPNFSPSLHASGPLRHYTAKTWARALDIGVDEEGKPFKKPMPTYHMAAPDSAALFAYCKTLK